MTREEIEHFASVKYPSWVTEADIWYNKGLLEGLRTADANPKSPWISIKDDLPCNHKELLLNTGYHTVSVFTYKKGGACGIGNMIIRNGKWEWKAWNENYLYWMPIPKLPKKIGD